MIKIIFSSTLWFCWEFFPRWCYLNLTIDNKFIACRAPNVWCLFLHFPDLMLAPFSLSGKILPPRKHFSPFRRSSVVPTIKGSHKVRLQDEKSDWIHSKKEQESYLRKIACFPTLIFDLYLVFSNWSLLSWPSKLLWYKKDSHMTLSLPV